MDVISEVVKQGGFAGVAAVFFWLYWQERKDRIASQLRIDELMEARRADAAETRNEVTAMLPGISQSLLNISDKIELSKQAQRRR